MGKEDHNQPEKSGRQPKDGELPPLPVTQDFTGEDQQGRQPPEAIPADDAEPPVEEGDPEGQYPSPEALEEEMPSGNLPHARLLQTLFWIAAFAGCGYLAWLVPQLVNQSPAPEDPRLANLQETTSRFETKVAVLEPKVAELEAKVAELESIRELRDLGNEAIANGSRTALYKLDDYSKNSKFPALKESANAEIIRVESYYITTRRYRGFPDELPSVPETDPIARLSVILLDEDRHWGLRAEAARRLGRMEKNVQAGDALAKASDSDSSLYVVQESILAFSRVTGFRSSGAFDSTSLNEWWTKIRSQFE